MEIIDVSKNVDISGQTREVGECYQSSWTIISFEVLKI